MVDKVDDPFLPQYPNDSVDEPWPRFAIDLHRRLNEWLRRVQDAVNGLITGASDVAAFRITKGGTDQSGIVSAALTKLTWSTAELDNVSGFDNANDRYTIREAGNYRIEAQVRWTTASVASSIHTTQIYKNGSQVAVSVNTTASAVADFDKPTNYVHWQGACVVGDYFEINVVHGEGSNKIVSGAITETYFQGFKLAGGQTGATGATGAAGSGGPSSNLFPYGNGYNGAAVLDGTNTFSWCSKSGSVYTLTQNVALTTMQIDSGVTLIGAGYRVRVNDTLTWNGAIQQNGNNASGSGRGLLPYASVFYPGNGVSSTNGTQVGAPTNVTGGANALDITRKGGAGGAGDAGAGATVGSNTALATTNGSEDYVLGIEGFLTGRSAVNVTQFIVGGGGAGGRGSASGCVGGGGGGPAGCIGVAAKTITGAGTGTYQCRGGNGGDAGGGAGNGGGGGGGSGGILWLVTGTTGYASFVTVDANGGIGGAAQGTGVAGSNGSDGFVVVYFV